MGWFFRVERGQIGCHVVGAVWSEPSSMGYDSAQVLEARAHHG